MRNSNNCTDPAVEVLCDRRRTSARPLILAAAQAGKHVLCEKPMALTAPELDVLRLDASKVHVREAFMVRFHPHWIEVRERVRHGDIGVRVSSTPRSPAGSCAGRMAHAERVGD